MIAIYFFFCSFRFGYAYLSADGFISLQLKGNILVAVTFWSLVSHLPCNSGIERIALNCDLYNPIQSLFALLVHFMEQIQNSDRGKLLDSHKLSLFLVASRMSCYLEQIEGQKSSQNTRYYI